MGMTKGVMMTFIFKGQRRLRAGVKVVLCFFFLSAFGFHDGVFFFFLKIVHVCFNTGMIMCMRKRKRRDEEKFLCDSQKGRVALLLIITLLVPKK